MATLNHVLDAIERQIGFPRSRSNGIARRLQESNLLPVGAPGVAPELNEDNVLDLVVALASDTELHNAVGAVRAYHAMTPGGAILDGAPQSIPNAPIAVALLVEDARAGVPAARKSRIEVSCNARAVAIHKPNGEVSRFVEAGADPVHWPSRGHHKSIALNVAAIADALDDIFGKVN
ncbi:MULTISPECIES: hypothetical protein [Bradyrhizobium]|uniref:hypothetical protein n=1 Tax=Bradyrhizobium TaxID=374 RepID=UPI000231D76C|nr:hypothetical protein [Bradyrhizobium japonicum]AJA63258.1 hypothetical protein RN69_25205 [Bradyrhizobium japonicum]KMJ98789.1 hypothetical protein CF64_11400 [Bradyrhizobium japonicum]MCS3540123.1 hypothetical protein [Bradyrhizobium japonicum]MCS3992674.1 hypothetical protein [Bradyrhizobium japonicum]MCS4012515.1 hypothetical protein [Bradyrhizobium japonicum]